ncbi:hypothetical protein GQ55_8G189800 [Panicum hallii var. hallii]|uniref:Rubredoxin-like domain-containing protein n=1 Tax=Panicum hallii var. hallii TaxID=1504633 RepID=A0A2T7CNY0_9POAL|nr:hypothetical protein GQ55_8G189800 [Panicum hallii var. hallii]
MAATQLPHCRPPSSAPSTLHLTSSSRRAPPKGKSKKSDASELAATPIPSRSLLSPRPRQLRLVIAPLPLPRPAAPCRPLALACRSPCARGSRQLAEMALQAPSSLLRAPERPSAPLRSSFSAPWLGLRLPAPARRRAARAATAARITMRVASKQAYICRDCGYIYNDRTPFDKLADNYFCPVCGAPKRRFRPYQPAVSKNANTTDVRKARKEQLKKDEAIGQALPIAIVAGIIALAGLYFYLNNAYN